MHISGEGDYQAAVLHTEIIKKKNVDTLNQLLYLIYTSAKKKLVKSTLEILKIMEQNIVKTEHLEKF